MLQIVKSRIINKKISIPSSKSVMQRAVALAVLSKGKTVLHNPSYCDDAIVSLQTAKKLGAKVQKFPDKVIIEKIGNIIDPEINCGESGLSLRMFSPIFSLFGKDFTITGKGSLLNRPIDTSEKALKKFGVSCSTNAGFLPLKISGKLKGGKAKIDASLSSQVLTGLLIALPLAKNNSEIFVTNLKSKPYIDLTLEIIKDFGVHIENVDYKIFRIKGNQKYKRENYNIEGDWSGAAFLLVAGLIAGKVELTNLNLKSKQADKEIITAIKLAKGKITINKNSVITEKSNLSAFEFDASDCPDLFPPLVILAVNCKGTSRIKGVNRLKYKESNRAEVLKNEFHKLGIKIKNRNDFMYITGGKIAGGEIYSHNDHRIAMTFSLAGLNSSGQIIIQNSECIKKSYPDFYSDLLN